MMIGLDQSETACSTLYHSTQASHQTQDLKYVYMLEYKDLAEVQNSHLNSIEVVLYTDVFIVYEQIDALINSRSSNRLITCFFSS